MAQISKLEESIYDCGQETYIKQQLNQSINMKQKLDQIPNNFTTDEDYGNKYRQNNSREKAA